ncbi:hypothetical protein [Nitrolancea hollandica]|uniref:Uncharacterized protein n=1 Tax=Nitrolancea hollandica Lb TaxID=1129897 RepID=I4EJU8_9BACT|nr:hypothetical protein [Nitrolancea hollandica]CCF84960.1 conserved hypothetical protein [Nitrolancea hollandica Lb]
MRLSYRQRENTLRLTLDHQEGPVQTETVLPGLIDVGEGGRLVGVEVRAGDEVDLRRILESWLTDPVASEFVAAGEDAVYITLSTADEAAPDEQLRTAEATFLAELDASGNLVALSIPRRGHGFEISYPSGNT